MRPAIGKEVFIITGSGRDGRRLNSIYFLAATWTRIHDFHELLATISIFTLAFVCNYNRLLGMYFAFVTPM